MTKSILVNRILIFFISISIVTSTFSMVNTVNAESNSAGFYVSAELPDNQLNKNVSYFDLRMKPSEKQTIKVKVFNENDRDMNMGVFVSNASSNANGLIDYSQQGIKDDSLKYPLESIAKPVEDVFTVPANGSKTVKIKLTMPEKEYDGIILGGLVFKEVIEKNAKQDIPSEPALSINNVLSYALAVKISENDNYEDINLDLTDVEARVINYEPVVTHYIKNDAAALSTKMSMTIAVTDIDTGETVSNSQNDNVSIAPDSVMPYSLKLKDTKLKEGNYISKVSITYKDNEAKERTVKFEKEFSVNEEHANAINDYNTVQESMPTWAKVIIAGIAILIAAVLVLIIISIKRKKTDVKNNKF